MKIALGQMNVEAGQIERNLETMKRMIDQAKSEGADLIVFPELCVSGYLLQDKWLDQNFCDTLEEANQKILKWSDGIGIIWGNLSTKPVHHLEKGRDGRHIRTNTAFFAQNCRWVKKMSQEEDGRYIKHLNPNYRIFDDSRYFLSGLELALQDHQKAAENISPFLFEIEGSTLRIGVEICEDMWSDDYALDVTEAYLNQQVDMIVNISSSPWTRGKESARDRHLLRHAEKNKNFVPFVYVNCVGMQNNGKTIVTFDGDSAIYQRDGKRRISLNDDFKEECRTVDGNEYEETVHHPDKVLEALICAIREMDRQCFGSRVKWIIGLSGGLDSTVNAALFTLALGANRLIAYNMASQYNSTLTKNNARELAEKLGIEIREGSIEKINQASVETLKEYGYTEEYGSLVYENIQARIRGHLLSTFASVENGVIVNNANKVETALGYCTLYGDAIGAFCPIADCTKVQLFELSRQINERFGREIIPANLLPHIEGNKILWEMPPSAELKDAQKDPMKWFYHDWLIEQLTEYPTARAEEIMQRWLEGAFDPEIEKWIYYYGLDEGKAFIQDLEWVLSTMSRNVFKRFQMPPVVMISRGAFGNDFREAQIKADSSNRYKRLKAIILSGMVYGNRG